MGSPAALPARSHRASSPPLMAVTIVPRDEPAPARRFLSVSQQRSTLVGSSPIRILLKRGSARIARTPGPQYASPSPTRPSSVYTRTRIQSKLPATTVLRMSVIFTYLPPLSSRSLLSLGGPTLSSIVGGSRPARLP